MALNNLSMVEFEIEDCEGIKICLVDYAVRIDRGKNTVFIPLHLWPLIRDAIDKIVEE